MMLLECSTQRETSSTHHTTSTKDQRLCLFCV